MHIVFQTASNSSDSKPNIEQKLKNSYSQGTWWVSRCPATCSLKFLNPGKAGGGIDVAVKMPFFLGWSFSIRWSVKVVFRSSFWLTSLILHRIKNGFKLMVIVTNHSTVELLDEFSQCPLQIEIVCKHFIFHKKNHGRSLMLSFFAFTLTFRDKFLNSKAYFFLFL